MRVSRTHKSLAFYLRAEERSRLSGRVSLQFYGGLFPWVVLYNDWQGNALWMRNPNLYCVSFRGDFLDHISPFMAEDVAVAWEKGRAILAMPSMSRQMSEEILRLLSPRWEDLRRNRTYA